MNISHQEINETCHDYDERNPQIYDAFERFALQAVKYRKRFSARAILERIRWETMISGGIDLKVNNNISPYLARKFMNKHPEYAGFFETRSSVSLDS